MTKYCVKCKQEKSIDEFYVDRTRKGGFSSYCKDCKRKHWREWSQTESGKGSIRLYKQSGKGRQVRRKANTKYAKTEKGRGAARRAQTSPKAKERRRQYRQSQQGKDAALRGQIKWRKNHPEKYKAHKAVHRAIKGGKLALPTDFDCSVCREEKASEYHHLDYSKQLEVVPVCRSCHLGLH